jgi:Protein of unknown function (DUF4058)
MPIHDWTRVDAGLFHNFHQSWIVKLCDALNDGVLPRGFFALVEQQIKGPIPDVLALELAPSAGSDSSDETRGGLSIASAPPKTSLVRRMEAEIYAGKANVIQVHHRHGDVVAIVEVVSPGNKGSKAEFRVFIEKIANLIRQGIHVLVVDLLPAGKRDPQGIHKAIWDQFEEEEFELSADKPLTLASYDASGRTAYVNFVAVGDTLPIMPLFFQPERYVPAPLEESYQTAWKHFPAPLKGLLECGTE